MQEAGESARGVSVLVLHRSPMAATALAEGLRSLDLAAEAGDWTATCSSPAPDVLVVDDRSGHVPLEEAVARCRGPRTRVLLLTSHPSTGAELEAAGQVLRSQTIQDLAAAVRRVARGHLVPAPRQPAPCTAALTPRECEVLELLASGARNERIAATLAISPHTVRTHVQNLMGKLEVDNRLAAVTLARRRGLLAAPGSGAP